MAPVGAVPKVYSAAAQTSKISLDKELPGHSSFHQFDSGAVRQAQVAGERQFPARYELISPVGMRRLAETCGEGALKYSDHNWEQGIDIKNLLQHALAHIYTYIDGDAADDHLAHAAWNLFAAMHMEEKRPNMQNLPTRQSTVPGSPLGHSL